MLALGLILGIIIGFLATVGYLDTWTDGEFFDDAGQHKKNDDIL